MFWQSIIPASLMVIGVSAGLGSQLGLDGMLLGRDWNEIERRMEHFGQEGDIPAHTVIKRQQSTAVQTNRDGTIDMAAWDRMTSQACVAALSQLQRSTNPSGTCVCYNLPALNNQTGAFAADLRLYQLSAPTGDFTGIPQQNIQVSLQYAGASVSPISPAAASKMVVARQAAGAAPPAAATPSGGITNGNNLKLLQTYMFVGQIDKVRMSTVMGNRAVIESLVMPVVTLSAINAAGQSVSTVVSSNEAAFVAGEFANEVVMSTFAMANMAVDKSIQGLENGTVPFVLPGVALMIFPVGLIVTSIWTVGLLGAVGFGTFQRMGFRDSYRSRIARAGAKAQVARI